MYLHIFIFIFQLHDVYTLCNGVDNTLHNVVIFATMLYCLYDVVICCFGYVIPTDSLETLFCSTEHILEESGATIHPPQCQSLSTKPVSQSLKTGHIRCSDVGTERVDEEDESSSSNDKSSQLKDTTSEDDRGIEQEQEQGEEKVSGLLAVLVLSQSLLQSTSNISEGNQVSDPPGEEMQVIEEVRLHLFLHLPLLELKPCL